MAMIKCPECGQEISDKAKKCVHCGKILIEDKPATKICSDCGKENPIDATECVHCGCPFEEEKKDEQFVAESVPVQTPIEAKPKKNIAKIVIPIVVIVVLGAIIGLIVYNIKVVKPKNTYNEAMTLLEKGKYDEADKLLDSISGYKDVATIQEQLKYESYAYSTINDLKNYLKNPDSFQPYDITFYASMGGEEDSESSETEDSTEEVSDKHPACIIHYGAQNGFGGNTTSYVLGYYNTEDKAYKVLGSCNSLDEDDYDSDDEDDLYDLLICKLVNLYIDGEDKVGDVDLARLKTVLKNDAYSTIKIIE